MDRSLVRMLQAAGIVVGIVGVLVIWTSVVKIVPVLGTGQGCIFGGLGVLFTVIGVIMTVYATRKLRQPPEDPAQAPASQEGEPQ